MRSALVALTLVSLVSVRAEALPFRRNAPVRSVSLPQPITNADGKTLTAEDAKGLALASLRSSRKYGIAADVKLEVGEVERIAPNEGRPITGKGGFVIVHEQHSGTPTRYTSVVEPSGKVHDAGSGPLAMKEKLRSRLRFGSLLTGQNLTQAGLTLGLGLLQIPNFIGGNSNAAGTTALTGATLALLIGNTTKLFFDASREHRDGVTNAMGQSVQFIKDRQNPTTRTAEYPTLAESYVFYKSKLEELAPGAVPLHLSEFSEKIWANGF